MTKKKIPKKAKPGARIPHVGKKLNAAKVKEAAKKLGVDVRAFDHNTKIVRTEAGDIDLEATYQTFATFEEARKSKEELENNIRLVKLQRLRGELVARRAVEASVNDALKELLNALLAMNRNLSPQLAAISDPKQILRMLDTGQAQAIECLQKTWRIPEVA